MDRTQVSLGHREHLEERAEDSGPAVRASQCGWAEGRNWDFLLPLEGFSRGMVGAGYSFRSSPGNYMGRSPIHSGDAPTQSHTCLLTLSFLLLSPSPSPPPFQQTRPCSGPRARPRPGPTCPLR